MLRIPTLFSLLATLLLVPAAALAQGPGFGPGGPGGPDGPGFGPPPFVLDMLDLDDAQLARLDEIRADFDEESQPIRERLVALHEQMRDLWAAEVPDRKAILAKVEQVQEQHHALALMHVDAHFELLSVLTPEQRAELQDFRADRQQRREDRAGRGRGRCDCGGGRGRGGW